MKISERGNDGNCNFIEMLKDKNHEIGRSCNKYVVHVGRVRESLYISVEETIETDIL